MQNNKNDMDKLISSIWDFNDPAATEERFTQWLDGDGASAPLEDRLLVQTQIARTYSLRGMFDQCGDVLADIETQMTDDMPAVQIRWSLEKGRMFNSAGKQAEAVPLFTRAYELANENDLERLAIDAAHMMGIASPLDQQLEWSVKTLKLVEASSDSTVKGWLGPMYNNIGWTYQDGGDYQQALAYFEKGLAWRESVGDEQGARIARWTVGRALRSLERYDEALKMQLALEQEIRDNQLAPDGYVFEELGELYLQQGDKAAATGWFAKAYEQLSQDDWLKANEAERLERLKTLGGVE